MAVRFFFLALIIACSSVSVCAKGGSDDGKLYVFGVATSLGDTTVYLSSIQDIEGVINSKSAFFDNCQTYVRQMETYLQEQTGQYFTCAFFFSPKKKKADKKWAAVRKNLNKEQRNNILLIPDKDFRFRMVAPSVSDGNMPETKGK